MLPHMAQARSFSYFRSVSFPPQARFPVIWVLFSLGLAFEVNAHAIAMRDDFEQLVRDAEGAFIGRRKRIEALDQISVALKVNNGRSTHGFLSSIPPLVDKGVLSRVVKPALLDEEKEDETVNQLGAEIFSLLTERKKVTKKVLEDSELTQNVFRAISRWKDKRCADCGEPATHLLTPLAEVLNRLVKEAQTSKSGALNAYEDEIIATCTGLTKIIARWRKQAFNQHGHGRWPKKASNGSLESNLWFLALGEVLVDLCENIIKLFPNRTKDLTPSFVALSRGLNADNFFLRMQTDEAEEILVESITFNLGMSILEATKEPSSLSDFDAEDRQYLARMRETYERLVFPSFFLRNLPSMMKFEDKFATVIELGLLSAFAFGWGALRTAFALRGVEDPNRIIHQNARGSWFGGGVGMADPTRGPVPPPTSSGQFLVHSPPPPDPFAPPPSQYQVQPQLQTQQQHPIGWKRAVVLRYGRLAAAGSAVIFLFNELLHSLEDFLWIKDTRSQLPVAFTTAIANSALMLGVLRNASFSFLPSFIFLEWKRSSKGNPRITIETDWYNL